MQIAWLAVGTVLAASAAAEPLYRLPWAEGSEFMFSQAPGGRITTHFAKAHLHAVDIAMPEGTAVLAARSGVVEALEDRHGASPDEEPLTYEGNFVRARHSDETAAVYAHLKYAGVAVRPGETVPAGRLLGYSGFTGDITQPHLHFAVTRTVRNESGWAEQVSLPFLFYVGTPPKSFQPRAGLMAKSDYSSQAAWPRAARDSVPRPRPSPAADEESVGWLVLSGWLACAFAGMLAFGLFSRRA